jgi:hypothetical protein
MDDNWDKVTVKLKYKGKFTPLIARAQANVQGLVNIFQKGMYLGMIDIYSRYDENQIKI